jgi:hypothetical protein
MKPRIYIEVRPGVDWLGRSNNIWCGVNIYARAYKNKGPFYLGSVHLFSVEYTIKSYFQKLKAAKRRYDKLLSKVEL